MNYNGGTPSSITSNSISISITPAACSFSLMSSPSSVGSTSQTKDAQIMANPYQNSFYFNGINNQDDTCTMTYKASSSYPTFNQISTIAYADDSGNPRFYFSDAS